MKLFAKPLIETMDTGFLSLRTSLIGSMGGCPPWA